MDTIDLVLAELTRLQASLTGSSASVQISRGTLARSLAQEAEPRQRATLAASLLAYIRLVTEARDAADEATAGTTAAEAAQAAAEVALRALQIVAAADATAEATNSEAARTAAAAALNAVVQVDTSDPDAAATAINAALSPAVQVVETEAARLQRAVGGQGDAASALESLRRQLSAAQEAARALDAQFGAPPATAALTPEALPVAGVTHHPRRTGVSIVFGSTFEVGGSWSNETTDYTANPFGAAATGGLDLTPDPVLYNPAGSNRRVFTSASPNLSHFPARGSVYRGVLRRVNQYAVSSSRPQDGQAPTSSSSPNRTWIYAAGDRLVRMGHDPEPSNKGGNTLTNAGRWNNWDATALTTFQYKPNGGLTMGFGGDGVIFSDLERYVAKGGKNCGSSEYCDDAIATNVEISFGTPRADPFRQPHTNFWLTEFPSPKLPGTAGATATPDFSLPGDQDEYREAGRYELLLSNYAGVDDRGTADNTADDVERTLSYAAYGLFQFVDEQLVNTQVGRVQTFHYGVDAFSNDTNRRTTDLTGDDVIEGTFRGKTLAYMVTSVNKARLDYIRNLYRVRGDIELRACIGGGATCTLQNFAASPAVLSSNHIAGAITNLEYAHDNRADGNPHWTTAEGVGPGFEDRTIVLNPGGIRDNGTFSGQVAHGTNTLSGQYEGALYGPAGAGLEVAGTWWTGAPEWAPWDGIVGSFGAACADGDCAPAAP